MRKVIYNFTLFFVLFVASLSANPSSGSNLKISSGLASLKIIEMDPKPFSRLKEGQEVRVKCLVKVNLDQASKGEVALVAHDFKDSVIAMVSKKIYQGQSEVELVLKFIVPELNMIHLFSTMFTDTKSHSDIVDSKIYYVDSKHLLAEKLIEEAL